MALRGGESYRSHCTSRVKSLWYMDLRVKQHCAFSQVCLVRSHPGPLETTMRYPTFGGKKFRIGWQAMAFARVYCLDAGAHERMLPAASRRDVDQKLQKPRLLLEFGRSCGPAQRSCRLW